MNKDVRPKVNTQWHDLGIELLCKVEGGVDKLKTIRKNNPQDYEECCTQMFQYWLDNAKDASWNTLVEAIKSIRLIVFAEELEKVLLYV